MGQTISSIDIVLISVLLCATAKEGKEGGIETVVPPPGSQPGDRIYFKGFEGELGQVHFEYILITDVTPEAQLNPKRKMCVVPSHYRALY